MCDGNELGETLCAGGRVRVDVIDGRDSEGRSQCKVNTQSRMFLLKYSIVCLIISDARPERASSLTLYSAYRISCRLHALHTMTASFESLGFASNSLKHSQSSQIVSKSKSPRLSAPQTLHLFLLSRMTPPLPKTSELALLRMPSSPSESLSLSAAAFSLAMFSASISASGESGMVSREEMLGERERKDVGVDGMDDDEKEEFEG